MAPSGREMTFQLYRDFTVKYLTCLNILGFEFFVKKWFSFPTSRVWVDKEIGMFVYQHSRRELSVHRE